MYDADIVGCGLIHYTIMLTSKAEVDGKPVWGLARAGSRPGGDNSSTEFAPRLGSLACWLVSWPNLTWHTTLTLTGMRGNCVPA